MHSSAASGFQMNMDDSSKWKLGVSGWEGEIKEHGATTLPFSGPASIGVKNRTEI